jgi:pilus assembly protein Flp/PilA
MFKSQKGQGMVEYLIIVCIVAVGTIGVVRVVGQNISVQYANIAKALGSGKDDNQYKAGNIEDYMYKKKDLNDFLQGSVTDSNKSKK